MMTHLPFLMPLYMSVRNLISRPGRSLLTALGIALGVAVVLAIETINASTLESLERIFDRTVGEAELIVLPKVNEETLEDELLIRVQRTSGVKVAAPTIWVHTVLEDDTTEVQAIWGAEGIQFSRQLEIRGIDPQLDPEVRTYIFDIGRFPELEKYETVISNDLAVEKELEIGDDLSFITPYGLERLEIVGILADEGAALINDGVVAFTSFEVLQEIFNLGENLNEIAVQTNPGISHDPHALDDLKNTLTERLGGEARTIYPAARGALVPRMLDSYQVGLLFFSIIAVFVGAFLIYNTFSMTVVERTREIGMLRAIGMNRRQVLWLVLIEAGLLSILGALLGVVAGILLARGLLIVMGGFIEVERDLISITREDLLLSVGIGVLVTFVSALIPASQAANISPLEALRSRSQIRQQIRSLVWISGLALLFVGWAALYRLEFRREALIAAGSTALMVFLLGAVLTIPLLVGGLERFSRLLAIALYGNEGRLGSANIRRAVYRTMLTVACLMIALVMIISIGSLSHSFKEDVLGWVNNALGGDLFVSAPEPLQESFTTQLLVLAGVEYVSPSRFHTVRLPPNASPPGEDKIEDLIFTALEPALFRQIGDMEFLSGQGSPEDNWFKLSQGSQVFISSVVADELGLNQGDELTLLTRRGEHDFTVAAVTTDFSRQGYVVTGTYADLQRWFAETGVDRYTITVEPGYDVQSVVREIEDLYKDKYNLNVQSTETIKGSVLGLLDQAFRMFDVLSMIGLIIGALGVINTLTMNVFERIQELGSLRSLGMTRGQVVRMILAEALALGALGSIYGVVFGYVISKLFVGTLNIITGYEVIYQFTIRPYVLGLLVTFIVSQIAAIGPGRRAARVNIVKALMYE